VSRELKRRERASWGEHGLRFGVFVAAAIVLIFLGCERDPYLEDIGAVAPYFRSSAQPVVFHGGPLEGGTAVLGPGDAAFWVKDGKVHVVNDAARKVAPALEQAPPSIKYDQAFVDAAHTGE